jgi:hypothetical protein
MARAKCKFHSVNKHWANLRMHPGRKTETNDQAYAELCLTAWGYLLKDWDALGAEAKVVADDIFKAMNMLRDAQVKKHDHLDGVLKTVLKSPSFRIGRFLTRFKW